MTETATLGGTLIVNLLEGFRPATCRRTGARRIHAAADAPKR